MKTQDSSGNLNPAESSILAPQPPIPIARMLIVQPRDSILYPLSQQEFKSICQNASDRKVREIAFTTLISSLFAAGGLFATVDLGECIKLGKFGLLIYAFMICVAVGASLSVWLVELIKACCLKRNIPTLETEKKINQYFEKNQ